MGKALLAVDGPHSIIGADTATITLINKTIGSALDPTTVQVVITTADGRYNINAKV